MLSGKEYRAARAEAMERAGNRCEMSVPLLADIGNNVARHVELGMRRCPETERLHAHHRHYPKTRTLEASDLLIVCKPHHEYLESQKMHKTRMF